MKTLYKSSSRGVTKIDWLTSFHSFSFGSYFDRTKMNFGPLYVINDDYIEPGGGFPTHPHNNMEIITIVLDGELSHTDSMGKSEIIKYGEIQKMSAGSGILHSEFNRSASSRVHLLQIWIMPDKQNIEPSYQKIVFTPEQIKNNLFKITGSKHDNTVYINQDAELFLSSFDKEKLFSYQVNKGRQVYIHVIDGKIKIDQNILNGGDAYGTDEQSLINMEFTKPARFILFDMAIL